MSNIYSLQGASQTWLPSLNAVWKVQLDKEKYVFAILYRSPSQSQTEFQDLMNNFELMLSRMSDGNPYCVIITGDFNCRSTNWLEDDIEMTRVNLSNHLPMTLGFIN